MHQSHRDPSLSFSPANADKYIPADKSIGYVSITR